MSDWIEVLRCNNRAEAELAKSLLDSAGIKAMIKADDLGGMRPHLSVSLGGTKLFVLSEDVAAAQKILEVPIEPEAISSSAPRKRKFIAALLILGFFSSVIVLFFNAIKIIIYRIFG